MFLFCQACFSPHIFPPIFFSRLITDPLSGFAGDPQAMCEPGFHTFCCFLHYPPILFSDPARLHISWTKYFPPQKHHRTKKSDHWHTLGQDPTIDHGPFPWPTHFFPPGWPPSQDLRRSPQVLPPQWYLSPAWPSDHSLCPGWIACCCSIFHCKRTLSLLFFFPGKKMPPFFTLYKKIHFVEKTLRRKNAPIFHSVHTLSSQVILSRWFRESAGEISLCGQTCVRIVSFTVPKSLLYMFSFFSNKGW